MDEQNLPRMNASDYWMNFFICYGVGFFALLALGVGVFIGSFIITAAAAISLLGTSIKIRIAQMERCNDIGWSWKIPWVVFGFGLAVAIGSNASLLMAVILLPVQIIVGLADFGFAIIVGCMPSRKLDASLFDPQAYRDSYRDYGAPNFSSEHAAKVEVKTQQRRIEAREDPRFQSVSGKRIASVVQAEPAPEPAMPPRVAGFGRKGILG
jgi:hypothetical protein